MRVTSSERLPGSLAGALGRIGLVNVYKPGVENVAADVLSRFGQHVEQ